MATPTVMHITNAVGDGTTSTYTFTLSSGPAPIVGVPVIIIGCTTAGFNGDFVINGGNLTTTFTVASSTNHISEVESGTGTSDVETFVLMPSVLSGVGIGIGGTPFNALKLLVAYGNAGPGINNTGIGQVFPTGQE